MYKKSEHKGYQSGLNENAIIEKCRSKDPAGYEALYKIYSINIYNLAYRILGNPDWADDAVQEIFIKIIRGIQDFQYKSKLSTWIYRIAVNQCRDMQRSQYRRKESSFINSAKEDDKLLRLEQIPDSNPNPRENIINRELKEKILYSMTQLPIEFRETIYLKEIENLSYEEISQITGVRLGTVKSRIYRARELLQNELKDIHKKWMDEK